MNLSALLSDRARTIPKKTCIKFNTRKYSYSEINEQVDSASGGLSALGLGVQEKAAIMMENCPEYIIAYFSILRAGGVAVPVNTFLVADEVSYILRDSGCRIFIYGNKFKSLADDIKKNIPGIITLMFNEIPQEAPVDRSVEDSEIAVLIYTSGTTGFPKGAMLTHSNLVSNAEACIHVMSFSPSDRILLFLPLFHSFSFTVCVLVPIFSGARIVLLESVKPFSKVIRSIFVDRITFFVAVPTIYNILSRKRVPFVIRLFFRYIVRIRACVSGASALPESTLHSIEKLFGIPLLEGYGLTEASPVVAVNPLKGRRKPGSVGPPLPGIQVATIDDEGKKNDPDSVGELVVKGPGVMKGYFNMKGETEKALKDSWLHTGDMARIDRDGYIYIVDRKKDMIIIDGMNIYPREVEDVVLKHSPVDECAMVGVPDGRGSEIPILFVKKKENTSLDENEIMSHLKKHIARFKIPRRIVFLEDFPKTATGKIKKNDLRSWKSP
jgi:long-chain acyl-CoA synthetase